MNVFLYVWMNCIVFLRWDDDMDQFGSSSAVIKTMGCDGSGGVGDGHIRTAATDRAAAKRSHYIQAEIRVVQVRYIWILSHRYTMEMTVAWSKYIKTHVLTWNLSCEHEHSSCGEIHA